MRPIKTGLDSLRRRLNWSSALGLVYLALTLTPAHAQYTPEEAQARAAGYPITVHGPRQMPLAGGATLMIPKGFIYCDSACNRVVRGAKGVSSDDQILLIADDGNWNSIVKFVEGGHVRDSDAIVPEQILPHLIAADERGNVIARARGLPEGHTLAWALTPRYDVETRRLEWSAMRDYAGLREANHVVVILGRSGYFTFETRSDTSLDEKRAKLAPILAGFKIAPGHRYEDFRPGDKVAPYGILGFMGVR